MKSQYTSLTALSMSLGLAALSQSAMADSKPHPGKSLHQDAGCMECHTAKPYNPQKTDSYAKLVKTVNFCNNQTNAGLFDDEVELVADYLNETYYHHEK